MITMMEDATMTEDAVEDFFETVEEETAAAEYRFQNDTAVIKKRNRCAEKHQISSQQQHLL